MNQPNFGAILDKPTAEVVRPPALPIGTYLWVTKGLPKMDKSTKKQTEFVEFTCVPLQAFDDVDADELAEFTKLNPLENIEQTLTFYLTEKSGYRLKDFLIDDLKIEDPGSMRPMLDATPGCQFVGKITHTPTQDGKGVFANITETAPVE